MLIWRLDRKLLSFNPVHPVNPVQRTRFEDPSQQNGLGQDEQDLQDDLLP